MTKTKGYEAKTYRGIDFHEDPNAPKGVMHFMNDYYTDFRSVDSRSKWQRFKDWLLRLLMGKKL